MIKTVVITGAGSGIGRSIATTLADRHWRVIATDLVADAAQETVDQLPNPESGHTSMRLDVTDPAQSTSVADYVADTFGLDAWVSNAGISFMHRFVDAPIDKIDLTFAVNLKAVMFCGQAAARAMIRTGTPGAIVNTASMAGKQGRVPFLADYVASKFGVVGLMKTLALEYANHGIRVNSVHPGAILTPMTSWQGAWDMMSGKPAGEGTEDDMLEAGYHFHALKGNGFLSPQRIADAALYLNSDLASAVTGVTLPVDAGHLLIPGVNASPVRA